MPEMHLRQPGLTYSACGRFTKNKKRIEKLIKTGDTNYVYKAELDKACPQETNTGNTKTQKKEHNQKKS